MPEKTKRKKNEAKNAVPKDAKKNSDEKDAGNWSRDQREKSYYYDDAYGYEIYNPDEDDEAENC